MLKKWSIVLLLLLNSVAANASEGPKFYWGVMIGMSEFSFDRYPNEELNPTNITGRVGYDFGKFLSLEGRLMASESDTFSDGLSVEVTYLGNVSAKLNFPFGEEKRINLYGLLGYTTWKWTATLGNTTADDTDNGVSYGLGVELFADRLNGLNFEVIRYIDSSIGGEDYTLDSASIGYVRRF